MEMFLRRHLPPPKTNFDKLEAILRKRKHMKLDVQTSKSLANSLDQCIVNHLPLLISSLSLMHIVGFQDPQEPAFNTLVRIMATRCMLSAEYFCSGSVSKDTFGHYGLASDIYTHFTSPIRRYAGMVRNCLCIIKIDNPSLTDVLAHRQLAAAINIETLHPSLHSKPHVEHVLEVVNRRHRMAQMAGRASVEFYVGLALKAREQRESSQQVFEDAFVIRTFKNGVGVYVSK